MFDIFGNSFLPYNNCWYISLNKDGSVRFFENRPRYQDGFWEEESEVIYTQRNYINIPENVKFDKCLWKYGVNITLENWIEESVSEDSSMIELEKLVFKLIKNVSNKEVLNISYGKKKIEQDEKVKEFYEMCVENEKKSIEEIFKLFRSLNNKI